jgi:hypothetical protein
VRNEDHWNRIAYLYGEGVTIPQLALRFNLTNQAIRYVLIKRNLLRKRRRKNQCGVNASAN